MVFLRGIAFVDFSESSFLPRPVGIIIAYLRTLLPRARAVACASARSVPFVKTFIINTMFINALLS